MTVAARAARTDLEALLRTRKLDRTLTTALPLPGVLDERGIASTGIALLDLQLGGGLPRGQTSEVVGPRSSGRTSLLLTMLASATARGEVAALIDTLDTFDVASAAACGIDLRRLLWIRGPAAFVLRGSTSLTAALSGTEGRASVSQGPAIAGGRQVDRLEMVVDRAIKALNLVLQAGGFGLVALDLAEVSPEVIRRLPFTTWFRLQRVIEGSETACLLLGAAPVARSAGGVTIALRRSGQSTVAGSQPAPASGTWHLASGTAKGIGHQARLFLGLDVEAWISRARWPETAPCRIRFGAATWPLALSP